MSELGKLLELVHDAHGALETFEAEYQDWSRPRPTSELVVHPHDPDDGHPRVHWRDAGPFPTVTTDTRRIWLKRPGHLRIEILRDGTLDRVGVLKETQWWRWSRDEGTTSAEAQLEGGGRPMLPPLFSPPLLEPIRLLAALWLRPAGYSVRAGRKVACAEAFPRNPSALRPGRTYELEFDAEHGTMLCWVALDGGMPVSVAEAITVSYETPIDPGRFTFVAPDGGSARRPDSAPPRRDESLLEDEP